MCRCQKNNSNFKINKNKKQPVPSPRLSPRHRHRHTGNFLASETQHQHLTMVRSSRKTAASPRNMPSPTSTDEMSDEENTFDQPIGGNSNSIVMGSIFILLVSVMMAFAFNSNPSSLFTNLTTTTPMATRKNSVPTKRIPSKPKQPKQLPPGFTSNTDPSSFLTQVNQNKMATVTVDTAGGLEDSTTQTAAPCFVLLSDSKDSASQVDFKISANKFRFVFGYTNDGNDNETIDNSSYWPADAPAPSNPSAIQMMLHNIKNLCSAKGRCRVDSSKFFVGAETNRGVLAYNVDLSSGSWSEVETGCMGGDKMKGSEACRWERILTTVIGI